MAKQTLKIDLKLSKTIKSKLEGRTQRWLLKQMQLKGHTDLTDVKISNKLNGINPFTKKEIETINATLNLDL
jgi:hypothetical protein